MTWLASVCRARYLVCLMLPLFLVGALLLPHPASAQGEEDPLIIPADSHFTGNISTVAQPIEVYGHVSGDVTSWSGDILVAGAVAGDVVSYSGNVVIAPSGRVDGHVMAFDGQLRQASTAQIAGQTLDRGAEGGALASVLDLFAPNDPQAGQGTPVAIRVLLGLVVAVLVLAFSLLWITLWPRRTNAAAAMLQVMPLRATVLGLLSSLILVLVALPLATLLAASLIGLPLLLLLTLLVQIPYIYGLATMLHLAGTREYNRHLFVGTGPTRTTVLIGAVVALGFGIITAVLPQWSIVLLYLLISPGLGAVILSRGGLALPRTA